MAISSSGVKIDEGLTLNVCNTLVENLLQGFWVLELFHNPANDGFRKLFLLSLLDLGFVSYPGVQHRFRLGCERRLLLQLKDFSLDFGGFLLLMSFCPNR